MIRKPVRRLLPLIASVSLIGGLIAVPLATPAASSGSATFANAGVAYTATATRSSISLAGNGQPSLPPIAQPECADGVNNDMNFAAENYPVDYQDVNADQGAPQSPTPAADAECAIATTSGRGTTSAAGTTTTVVTTKAWAVGRWNGQFVRMTTGTAGNIGQVRQITSNTATTLTLASALPSATASGDGFIIVDAAGSELGADNSEVQTGYQAKAPISMTATVNANGTIATAASTVTFPSLYQYTNISVPLSVVGSTVVNIAGTLKSGDINTDTGVTTVTFTLNAAVTLPALGGTTCTIPAFDVTLTSTPTAGITDGPVALTLSNYNATTGMVSLGNNTFTMAAATGTALVCDPFNGTFGLPSPMGNSMINFDMKLQPAAANAQPVAVAPTVTPAGPYTEGQTVTLNGSGTDTSLVPCVTGGTIGGTGCNGAPPPNEYKWTQLSGPTVTWISNSLSQNPQVKLPNEGTYTFLEQVQDGSTNVEMAPVTQTVAIVATSLQPTANAGPDLSLIQGGATGTLKGSSTDPAPADVEANRSYAWAATGGTCGAPPTLSSPSVKSPTVTPPGSGAPCYTDFTLTVTSSGDTGPGGTDTARVNVRPVAAAGTISGVVQGCTNVANPGTCSPLSGAIVDVYSLGSGSNPSTGSTYVTSSAATGGTGAFSVSGLTNGTQYRLRYRASGYQTTWFGGGTGANSATLTPPNSAADANLPLLTANTGTISGTVTVQNATGAAPNAPDGTSVRLYDARGYVGYRTTSSGAYSFAGVPAGNAYYLQFGKGSAYQANWSGPAPSGKPSSRSQGFAVRQTVTAGGTTTLNAELVTDEIVFSGLTAAGSTAGGCSSNGCSPSSPTIVVAGATVAANGWAGYQIRWGGSVQGAGKWYTVKSNTAASGANSTVTLAQTTALFQSSGAPGGAPGAGLGVLIAAPMVRDSGTASGGATATTVTQGTVSVTCGLLLCSFNALPNQWAAGQWAGGGYQLRILFGPGAGQVRDISANTATQITVGSAFSPAPTTASVWQIEAKGATTNATLQGTVKRGDTGAPIFAAAPPGGQGVEVRLYTTTGAFLGKTLVTAPTVMGTFGGQGRNYSFDSWNPGTGTVSGISPGDYKVMFRVIGPVVDGAGRTFCSTWASNTSAESVYGGPGAGTLPFAPTVTVKPASLNTFDASLGKSVTAGSIVLNNGVPTTPGAACTLN